MQISLKCFSTTEAFSLCVFTDWNYTSENRQTNLYTFYLNDSHIDIHEFSKKPISFLALNENNENNIIPNNFKSYYLW